jgi:hypothetical protein
LPPIEDPKIINIFKFIDLDQLNTILLGKAVYNLFQYAETQKEFSERSYESFDEIILSGREEVLKEIISEYSSELKLLGEGLKISSK